MNRRDVVSALLAFGAGTVPLRANSQTTKGAKLARIVTFPDFNPLLRDWFFDAMHKLDWASGRDFIVDASGVQLGQYDMDDAVKRIVADKPDVVLTLGTAYAVALHRATGAIPIVMISSGYPVEAGVANSLARPGKNVTGNAAYAGTEVWGKLLQLLRDVKPNVRRISVFWTYVPPAFFREEIEPIYKELRDAERLLGLKLQIVEAVNADQVPAALAEIDAERPDALLLTSGLARNLRPALTEFAEKRRLPTITEFAWRPPPEPQPLMSYGPVFRELVRSTAGYVDSILKGAKPGDLPIQQPAKFEMVVSLKTAKALGLTIPPTLLARADEVIE